MSKIGKILFKTALVIAGVIVGFVLLLQLLLNSTLFSDKVRSVAAEYVDGSLNFSGPDISLIRHFPSVGIGVRDLSISAASCPDTLLKLSGLDVRVNPWALLRGQVMIDDLRLGPAEVKLRSYTDGRSNLNFLRLPESDSSEVSSAHPEIVLQGMLLEDIRLDYDNQNIYVAGCLNRLTASLYSPSDTSFNGSRLQIDTLVMDAAGMDVCGNASLELLPGAVSVDASLRSGYCPIGQLIAAYGPLFAELANELETDACAALSIRSRGLLSEDTYPHTELELTLPPSRFVYHPLELNGGLGMSVDAVMGENGILDVGLSELKLTAPGISINASGTMRDLLSESRHLKLSASGQAVLDTLVPMLFDSLEYSASGTVNLALRSDAELRHLLEYKFYRTSLSGKISSSSLSVRNSGKEMEFAAFAPHLSMLAGKDGIDLDLDLDSLQYRSDDATYLKIREMSNCGRLYLVESRGQMMPKLELNSNGGSAFVRSSSGMAGALGVSLMASLQKRVRPNRNLSVPDSVRRRRLDSLRRGMYRAEGDFADKDIRINLDSTLRAYWRQWRPAGSIAFKRGFVATPVLPLRTRINAFSGKFDDSELFIDTVRVCCGSSDMAAKGEVRGIRKFVAGRGVLDMSLSVKSDRLNLNELLSAVELADTAVGISDNEEYDESFVTDTLENAVPDISNSVIAVPGNVRAKLDMDVSKIEYTDLRLNDFSSSLAMRDRTVQLLDTRTNSNLGAIALDAYYSTKALDDISMGINLNINDVSAYDLIHLLPSAESLMPALKSFKGKLSCDVSATAKLDSLMNVMIPTVSGLVRLGGRDLYVEDAGNLRRITSLLFFKDKNIGHIDDLLLNAVVHDSKLELFPFELGVDRYRLALHGMHSYDGTMNYHVSLLKSPLHLLFGINIFGTTDNWRFSIGRPKYVDGVPAYTAQMDSVQINIGRSIKNIFRMGVEDAKSYNERNVRNLQEYVPEAQSSDASVAAVVFEAMDSLAVERTLEQWNADAENEAQAVLLAMQPEDLMKEFESLTYEKSIERKMKRLIRRRRREDQE